MKTLLEPTIERYGSKTRIFGKTANQPETLMRLETGLYPSELPLSIKRTENATVMISLSRHRKTGPFECMLLTKNDVKALILVLSEYLPLMNDGISEDI